MKSSESKQILLTDQYGGSSPLKLVESYVTPDGPHTNAVIATLYGVLSDFSNETRNGRRYSKELWKRVLSSELFNEMIETKTLFGEPDHPMDVENRLEVHIPYVSHIIRDPKINPESDCVEGYLDILDTPYGRIIKTLIDYGCTLGVSSRGSGDTVVRDGKVYVEESTYNFITWDIVARPSNKKARIDELDTVSLEEGAGSKTIYEFMEDQIKEMIKSHDKSSLKLTESLISSTDIPNKADLVSLINESLSPEELTSTKDELMVPKSDLDEAYSRVLSLKKENFELGTKNKDLQKSFNEVQNTISELSKLNENLQSMVTSYMEKLSESYSELRTTADDKRVNESSSSSGSNCKEDLEPQITEVVDGKYNEEVLEAITKLETIISSEIDRVEGTIKSSNGKDNKSKEIEKDLKKLNSQVEDLSKKLENSQNENVKMIRKHSNAIDQYFKLRCSMLGVNEQIARNEFRNRLSEYDVKDIDDVLLEMYSSSKGSQSNLNESYEAVSSPTSVGSLTVKGSRHSRRPSEVINESISQGDNDDEISALADIVGQLRGPR